jgi:hypothetical protein
MSKTYSSGRAAKATFDVDGIHLEMPARRTLREVAAILNISSQAVQGLEQSAMRKVIRKLKFQLTVIGHAT